MISSVKISKIGRKIEDYVSKTESEVLFDIYHKVLEYDQYDDELKWILNEYRELGMLNTDTILNLAVKIEILRRSNVYQKYEDDLKERKKFLREMGEKIINKEMSL